MTHAFASSCKVVIQTNLQDDLVLSSIWKQCQLGNWIMCTFVTFLKLSDMSFLLIFLAQISLGINIACIMFYRDTVTIVFANAVYWSHIYITNKVNKVIGLGRCRLYIFFVIWGNIEITFMQQFRGICSIRIGM